MGNSLLTIGLAFLEGLALIASPCILPILPFILSSSIDGGKKRPLGITLGFVCSFAVFTLFSRKLVQISGIDLNLIRDVSFVLLAVFGVVMLSTYLTEAFNRLTARFARIDSPSRNTKDDGIVSGFLFGCLIGLIWTPCAGPILATVIVQTVLQTTTWASLLTVLAFSLGAGIPMLIIALFGRAIIHRLGFFKQNAMLLRKLLGIIILSSVVYMVYGDTYSSTSMADTISIKENRLIHGLANPYPAPEISGITAWINSEPLQISQLKGKVVLIDFWTYSCINCIRTLPYLKEWYAKYQDKGLVIIGVHTPEFDFEKNFTNVKQAVEKDGIEYPVALDDSYQTWQNFGNQYWPAHYLIDQTGKVVYTHFGEGDYDITENNIRFLLGLNRKTTLPTTETTNAGVFNHITPETYLGYERANHDFSPHILKKDGSASYTAPLQLIRDQWALDGKWIIGEKYITSADKNAAIKIHFRAQKAYVVMGNSTAHPITVQVLLNSQPILAEKGNDVKDSTLTVSSHTLYEVVVQSQAEAGILQLIASEPGLEIYTFTFG